MTDFVSGKAPIPGGEPVQCQLTRELTKTLRIMKLTAVFLLAAPVKKRIFIGLAEQEVAPVLFIVSADNSWNLFSLFFNNEKIALVFPMSCHSFTAGPG